MKTILEDGTIEYRNAEGELHREDGPSFIDVEGGYTAWYLNDQLHREDGPALEYEFGDKSWYLNGKLHCTLGPAINWDDGSYIKWFINGVEYSEEEFNKMVKEK